MTRTDSQESMHDDLNFSALRKKLESFTGKFGSTEVEEPIYDTVAILNLIGLTTIASCGGHGQEDVIKREIEKGNQHPDEKYPDNYQFIVPYVGFGTRRDPSGVENIRSSLDELLGEFYKMHKFKDERLRLVLETFDMDGKLYGVKLINFLNTKELTHKDLSEGYLSEYEIAEKGKYVNENLGDLRKEFEDFAEFLYKKFISGYQFRD